jgi:hypothetical protein
MMAFDGDDGVHGGARQGHADMVECAPWTRPPPPCYSLATSSILRQTLANGITIARRVHDGVCALYGYTITPTGASHDFIVARAPSIHRIRQQAPPFHRSGWPHRNDGLMTPRPYGVILVPWSHCDGCRTLVGCAQKQIRCFFSTKVKLY